MARAPHKANVHGAAVGKGGLADQMAARKRRDGTTAGGEAAASTSIFDPTLCELLVRWFSPAGGLILDPFAGGSVRGIVSAMLGRSYIGIELRDEQVRANRVQAATILPGYLKAGGAVWVQGDSRVVLDADHPGIAQELHLSEMDGALDEGADMVLTCPPYADLEVYSDDPADISNMSYAAFRMTLATILVKSAHHLKNDRFMAVVIGDARSKATGELYGIPAHVINDMQDHGLKLHNHAILATPAGSAPTRARTGFTKTRKLCGVHQHVLIFLKGNERAATAACGTCDFGTFDPARFGEVEGGGDGAQAALAAALGG